MTTLDDLIKKQYPNAVPQALSKERIRNTLAKQHRIDISKVLLATALCADDVIAVRGSETSTLHGKLNREFLGPFAMGGLAGIPYSGLTGISTVAHHIPEGGAVAIVYGPHIGINDQGETGKLLRPGQHCESAACGALTLALRHFQSRPDYQPAYDDDDTEQTVLERRLLPYREEILAADNPLKAATDCAYAVIHELVHRYVKTRIKEFHCEYIALAGGVVINTGIQHDDYIDLRHLSVRHVEEIGGAEG